MAMFAEVMSLRVQLREAKEERDRAYKEKGTLFLDVIRAKDKCDAAIERAEAAEALVARLKEAAIRRVVRSAKPRLWCCGLCGDWWADGEAPCHANTCVLYLAPTEAQARQKEGDRAGNLLSRHQH